MNTEVVPPLLRGWLHLVCAVAAVPAGALLITRAADARSQVAAAIYGAGTFVMFAVSAAYHRRTWSASARPWMKRADHAAIFVMIAGTYSPICLVALREDGGSWLFIGAWVGALLGVVGAVTGIAERRVVGLVAYSGLGWAAVLAMPQLVRRLDALELVLLFAGGALYSLGSIGLGLRWPNPAPGVFGYHEVWHLLVVVAAACHFVVVWRIVVG